MRGAGTGEVNFTVVSSISSARMYSPPSTVAQWPGAAHTFGLMAMFSHDHTTSSAVKGLPSDHFNPSRSDTVSSVKSSLYAKLSAW